jgi:hypothetical protein
MICEQDNWFRVFEKVSEEEEFVEITANVSKDDTLTHSLYSVF